jgi:hypothetical protein
MKPVGIDDYNVQNHIARFDLFVLATWHKWRTFQKKHPTCGKLNVPQLKRALRDYALARYSDYQDSGFYNHLAALFIAFARRGHILETFGGHELGSQIIWDELLNEGRINKKTDKLAWETAMARPDPQDDASVRDYARIIRGFELEKPIVPETDPYEIIEAACENQAATGPKSRKEYTDLRAKIRVFSREVFEAFLVTA